MAAYGDAEHVHVGGDQPGRHDYRLGAQHVHFDLTDGYGCADFATGGTNNAAIDPSAPAPGDTETFTQNGIPATINAAATLQSPTPPTPPTTAPPTFVTAAFTG